MGMIIVQMIEAFSIQSDSERSKSAKKSVLRYNAMRRITPMIAKIREYFFILHILSVFDMLYYITMR